MTHTPRPFTPKQAALHLHKLGANVLPIGEGSKRPTMKWKEWETTRQPSQAVDSMQFPPLARWVNGTEYSAVDAVGVICGVNDWRWFDVDAVQTPDGGKVEVPDAVRDALLRALGLPDSYPWCGRSKSGQGWHVAVRCAGELPAELATAVSERNAADGGGAGVKCGTPNAAHMGNFDHIELRWAACQTVLPSPNGYHAVLPSAAPAVVSIAQVTAAFYAVATPKPKGRPAPAQASPAATGRVVMPRFDLDRAIADLDSSFDLVAWFQAELGGDTQNEPNGEVRILGHGGLLVNPDKGEWHIHNTGEGGLWIKAIAHTRNGGVVPSGAEYVALVRTAAAFAGVVLHPDPQTTARAAQVPALAAGATAVTPAQAEAEDDAPEPWEPPLPLGRATEALPAFPTEALPSWLRAYVEALAAATQTPADMAATLALAVVATTCQRRTRVCVRPGWVEPTNLYTLVAMPPANRKSAVFAALVKPIDDYEREQRAIAEPIIKGAESESRILENRLKSAEKDASGRGVEATIAQEQARELAAELAAFRVPALPRFIVGDVTPEKLASLICEQGGRMALLDDEGGFFDILAGRYSSGQPNLECVLKGHAGTSPLRVDRGTRPSEFVESPALTLGLAVQPAVLDGLAATASFRGRGLLGRFLYAVPLSPVGTRVFDAPAVPAQVDAAYHRHVTALLARPTGLDERGTSAPDTLHLTPAALAALKTMDGWLEPQLAEGAELGSLADWAGKLLGAVARIAGLVHMAEHGPAGIAQPISGPTMDAAVAIGHYYLAHAQAAFGLIGADAGAELARKVWRWIEARGVMAVSRSDIWQGLRKGSALSTVDDLEAPLGLLVRHGYLRLAPAAPVTGRGRKPTPVYEVNPLPSPNNPNRTGHGATFAPVPPMIAATDRIDRIDRTPPSTSTTPIAPDAVAAGLAALALAEAHLARHAAALTDEVDTVDTDEAPEGMYWNEV